MRLPTIVFGLLVALCVVLALTFVIEEVPFEDVDRRRPAGWNGSIPATVSSTAGSRR